MNLEWGQGLLQNLVSAPVGQIILLFFAFGIGQIVIPPFPGDILLLLAGGLWPQGFAQDAWFCCCLIGLEQHWPASAHTSWVQGLECASSHGNG